MTISQVALSNTFNEFRQTVNDISNTVNSFTNGTGTTFSSNTISANTVTLSTLTSGRVALVGSGGTLTDDSGITFDASTNALNLTGPLGTSNTLSVSGAATLTSSLDVSGATVFLASVNANSTLRAGGASTLVGDVNIGGNNIKFHSANGSATFAGTTYARDVHGRQVHAVSNNLAFEYTNTWTTARGEDPLQHLVLATGDVDGSHDIAVVNLSTAANAYGEFIAYTASGNSENGWVSMGVNSQNYDQGAFSITKSDDAYLLYSAPVGTTESGDLVIGTSGNGTGNKIIFSADGFDDPANNTQMVITPGQNIHIEIDTQSSNTTTGALTVNGGIGLVGNLNIGGNVAITGTITLGGGGNTVSTSSLAVDNPMIFLGSNNAADTFDLGFNGEYYSGSTKYNGLVRDASDSGKWKLFSGITNKPANTVNFTGATYDTLYLGKVEAVGAIASTNTTSGSIVVTGGVGVSGAVNIGGAVNAVGATFTSTVSLQQIIEKATTSGTAAGSTVQFDVLSQGVLYYTSSASGNWTLNVRGSSGASLDSLMTDGQAVTIAFLATQGGSAYRQTALTIDGNAVTPKWQGGAAPSSGNANSVDIYSLTIVKTGSATFTVFESATRFA